MTAARHTWAITRRELGAYFSSPIAYIVLAGFTFLSGLLFFNGFFVGRQAAMDGFFDNLPLVFLFFAPALAMRLLAEERGAGTIELLLTMPVRDRDVVLGKFAATLAVLAVALAATLPFAFTVAALGELDWGPVIGGYLGAFLLGGLYLAAGLFASSVTRAQVIAFVLGLVLCFGIFALQWFVTPSGGAGRVLLYMSPGFHFDNLARGYLEIRTIVYFLSGIAVFVVLSIQALEARKWR
jgi:ABC-2 type transport system permease protein